jgi:hypothetical protein
MLRRTFLPLVGLLLATPAGAQACLGLPARAHTTVALAFEGTDGLTGRSAALLHGRSTWGLQVRAERYDDQPVWRDPWYGAELQLSRARPEGRLCGTAAARYQLDKVGSSRYERLRWPVGFAWGRPFVVADSTGSQPLLTFTPFVQPQLLLQHERLRRSSLPAPLTRTRIAAAATAGFGISAGPGLVRTSVQYATLPEETLNGRHNWFELTVQVGFTF